MSKDDAIKILIQTAKDYLVINGDDGVLPAGDHYQIEKAIEIANAE